MWSTDLDQLGIDHSDPMYNWLVKAKSVTKSIKWVCNQFSVDLIDQNHGSAYLDEQQLLNIDEDNSLIRQVHLNGDGVAWSYGRVVVPYTTYQHFKTEFDTLGNRSIGDVLLHNNPNTLRGPFEYARIATDSDLFRLATADLPEPIEHDLWGRRSIFTVNGYNMLVVEIYLPKIPVYSGELIIAPPKPLRYGPG